ncbi:MAG TPA: peroxiredoxin [Caulobacteraceae bacterium]|jgi:peroxiredoxin|nr:peroxiredoxin [Caulobacteraceae bacterium]
MKHLILGAAAAALISTPVLAALPVGAKAPEFKATSFQAGKPGSFDLAAALKKGPVVLYFFPAAHTAGCNLEAHLFADSIDKFHAQGATVIGVTAGNVDQLAAFSTETEHCSGKFPVAADPDDSIAKQYDATFAYNGKTVTNRTSYVISPKGDVLFAYTDLKPDQHIALTLDAVSKWRTDHGK